MEIKDFKNIHFIGIGGISMSGLAEILAKESYYNISGSDVKSSSLTENLKNKGVKIYIGQSSKNINKNIDLVVYTSAIKENNKELVKAKELGIKTLERAEFLGNLMKAYKYPICISGTHGKTTTSSMVSEIFLVSNNPTISIGGILPTINSNVNIGSKDYFILESCEYCESFLKFNPHSAIILNIDEDHLDYFKDLNHIYNSFKNFANLIPKDGLLVINSNIKNYEEIIKDLTCNVITYGENNGNFQAKNIVFDKNGFASYTAFYKGLEFCKVNLNVPGKHNVYNSLSAIAIANFYQISKEDIEKGLSNFKGTGRRFEFKGEFSGVKVIDDYAHHPTEILATLSSASSIVDKNKIWCIFQPHTFTRTKTLLNEFAKSFENADEVIVLDIYPAREEDKGEVHSKDLVKKLKENNKNAIYIESFEKAKEYLSTNCKAKDMLITMGAGDVYLLSEMLLK